MGRKRFNSYILRTLHLNRIEKTMGLCNNDESFSIWEEDSRILLVDFHFLSIDQTFWSLQQLRYIKEGRKR